MNFILNVYLNSSVGLRRCRLSLPGPMSDNVSAFHSVSTKADQAQMDDFKAWLVAEQGRPPAARADG